MSSGRIGRVGGRFGVRVRSGRNRRVGGHIGVVRLSSGRIVRDGGHFGVARVRSGVRGVSDHHSAVMVVWAQSRAVVCSGGVVAGFHLVLGLRIDVAAHSVGCGCADPFGP